MLMDEDEFYETPEDYEPPPTPDHYFVDAQKEIRELYEKDREGGLSSPIIRWKIL